MIMAALAGLLALTGPAVALGQDTRPDWMTMQFQAWTVIVSSDGSEAGTVNEAGNVFGFVCGDQCVNFIDLQVGCSDAAAYRATATLGKKQFDLGTTCHVIEDRYVFVVDLNPAYLSALAEGQTISIQLDIGETRAAEASFSLLGCREAVYAAAIAALPYETRS